METGQSDTWPKIAAIVVTYDRPDEIRKTISALVKHARYAGALCLHIADDNSPGDYLQELARWVEDKHGIRITSTVTDRKGWGANVNKALVHCRQFVSEYAFLIEDDYVSLRDLDFTQGVALLEARADLGVVRYDGIAGHKLDLHLREEKNTRAGTVSYLHIQGSSPHLNLYSNRPHLKVARFHDKAGDYPEGRSLGKTEEAFAMRVKRKYDEIPQIVALTDGIARAFDHIGKSRQGSELDTGGKE